VVYDATPTEAVWARKHANVVLTNPDMLHVGILPSHGKWAPFFRNLRFVVVDEVHVLRGIFGSHVGNVLRRLRRIARFYGADPTFIGSSATIGNPGELLSALIGLPVEVVDRDASPGGTRHHVLWNPEVGEDDRAAAPSPRAPTSRRPGATRGADDRLCSQPRSRAGVSLGRERLDEAHAARIAPYRAGYLAEDRRRIEKALFSGELLGVTATNALELGIDVGGLDAAVLATFPGTVASYRQQTGRAGRSTDESLAVLVAGQDALDQWFMNHPADLFSRPSDAAVVNPENPEVLAAHMTCAAYEMPMEPTEAVATFDPRWRNWRWIWSEGRPGCIRAAPLGRRAASAPDIDIRTAGGPPFTIVDQDGQIMGRSMKGGSPHRPIPAPLPASGRHLPDRRPRLGRTSGPGLRRRGRLTPSLRRTRTSPSAVHGTGSGASAIATAGRGRRERRRLGRKRISDRTVLSYEPLDMPPRHYTTQAVWFVVDEETIRDARVTAADLPGVLHAAEHTAIAMLPLFAICDRWDIGGLSTAYHPEIGGPVVHLRRVPGRVWDRTPGLCERERAISAPAAGAAECLCGRGMSLLRAVAQCGNFNEPLDKDGAIRLLEEALG
jgi:DEAD/DEAH box helicase domain-containing protein